MTTGERIKQARKKVGMTQAALADKLGISYVGVSQWENDLRNPKYETLKRIASVLQTTPENLMGVVFEDAPSALRTDLTSGVCSSEAKEYAIRQCVFAILGELYGSVNEKMLYDSAGFGSLSYYVVGIPPNTFVLHEHDIRLLMDWISDTLKASMKMPVEQIMDCRPLDEIAMEMLEEGG